MYGCKAGSREIKHHLWGTPRAPRAGSSGTGKAEVERGVPTGGQNHCEML